jgi:transketolase C-terminal domain/subunit
MLLSTGGVLGVAVSAADLLALQGVQAQVVSVPVLKPFPTEAIRNLLLNAPGGEAGRAQSRFTKLIVTLEEHVLEGGLHSAVCQALASLSNHPPLMSAALTPDVVGKIGSQTYLRGLSHLSPEGVAARVQQRLALRSKVMA